MKKGKKGAAKKKSAKKPATKKAAKKPATKKAARKAAKKPAAKKPAAKKPAGKTSLPKPEMLSFADASSRIEALSTFEGSYDTVALFDGDVTIAGDFLKTIQKSIKDADIVVVTGNLTVGGDLAIWDNTPGLYVAGHTRADTLQGGDCEIYIHDATIKYFVYGYYNHGILETGTVETPWVINSDHDLRVTAPSAKHIDNFRDSDSADFTRQNIPASFVIDIIDPEYDSIVIDKFYKRLVAGKPVLKTGAKTATEAALAEVDSAKDDRQLELDLAKKKLKKFPAEALKMPWLKKLVLDDNDIGEIPEAIGKLTELEHLSVESCGLESLPDAIGTLTKLRVLRICGNSFFRWETEDGPPVFVPFPDLSKLEALEELDMSSTSVRPTWEGWLPPYLPVEVPFVPNLKRLDVGHGEFTIPDRMRGLPSLEEIKAEGGSSAYMRKIPEGIGSFPNLKKLDISSNFFEEIPDEILNLKNLEELDIGCALGLLKKPIPDLSKLPKLRVLNLSGYCDHTGVPVPKHEVLRHVLAMDLPNLVALDVDRWSDDDRGNRPKVTVDDFKGIGKFEKLEILDLAFNGLSDLPEETYGLKHLKDADFRYCGFPSAVRQRICATWPTAKLDLRNQRPAEDEVESDAEKRGSALIQEGNRLRGQKKWNAALAKYDEALALYTDGTANSAYNQLYALYGKMWVCGTAGFADDGAEATKAKFRKQGLELARQCLQLVPPVWQIWPFTHEGVFHREVVRYATNLIAWLAIKTDAPSPEDLSGALELIERGVACADRQHNYVRDTHARVLVALGRHDEAWKVVHQIQALDPSFKDIKDLAKDKRYKKWLAQAS